MISFFLISVILAVTAYFDLKNREISNAVHLLIVIVGWLTFFIEGGGLAKQVLQGAVVFLLLLTLVCIVETGFNSSVMGGGDVKLFGALAFSMCYEEFMLMIILLTIILLGFVVFRLLREKGKVVTIAFAPFVFFAYVMANVFNYGLFFNGGIYV